MRRIGRVVVVGFGLACTAVPGATLRDTSASGEVLVRIEAKRFEYTPAEVTLRKGVPAVLELVSLDREHGFKVPALGLRADVVPDAPTRVRLVPDRVGRFPFRCDVFCGGGHEEMQGAIVVVE